MWAFPWSCIIILINYAEPKLSSGERVSCCQLPEGRTRSKYPRCSLSRYSSHGQVDSASAKNRFARLLLAVTPANSVYTLAPHHHLPRPLELSARLQFASRHCNDLIHMNDRKKWFARFRPANRGRPKAAEMAVVILPGFGNDASDYVTPLGQPEEKGLVAALERRGFKDITVLPLQRFEWARVAGGLLDGQFYRCEQSPYSNAYGWYIERARAEIKAAMQRSGSKVFVVAHSAGGWLARAVLGDGVTPWGEDPDLTAPDFVHALVTLGAPHFPPPKRSDCATRGALEFVSKQFPGALLSSRGVQYVTVAGDAIVGNDARANEAKEENEDLDALYSQRGEGSAERVAFANYKVVSGEGTLRGDGVIPLNAAHLEGATQVTLPDVRHSFNEAGTTQLAKMWYGSDEVVAEWIKAVNIQLE